MRQYLNITLQENVPDKLPFTVQALWQEDFYSVAVSSKAGSSLIKDEERSNLNEILLNLITQEELDINNLSLLEINNVCHHGLELGRAIRRKKTSFSKKTP